MGVTTLMVLQQTLHQVQTAPKVDHLQTLIIIPQQLSHFRKYQGGQSSQVRPDLDPQRQTTCSSFMTMTLSETDQGHLLGTRSQDPTSLLNAAVIPDRVQALVTRTYTQTISSHVIMRCRRTFASDIY